MKNEKLTRPEQKKKVKRLKHNETCPKCGSDNIANEGPKNDQGSLELTCHDCSFQWEEES